MPGRTTLAYCGCVISIIGLLALLSQAGAKPPDASNPATSALVAAPAGQATPEGAVTILDNADTYWRWCKASRPATVTPKAAGEAEMELLTGKKLDAKEAIKLYPELPAGQDWTGADFDDSFWPRTSGTDLREMAFAFVSRSMNARKSPLQNGGTTALVRLRGKFGVTDPAAVKALTLTMKFRGGAVVYLNGAEVARGGLTAGPVSPSAAGDPYPKEAFVDADGKILPAGPGAGRRGAKVDEKAMADGLARRNREIGPVTLPANRLRKGANVLAIELHRSDYIPAVEQYLNKGEESAWLPCDLLSLRLAGDGPGAVPNCSRPKGVQVWGMDRNDRVGGMEYGDPNEPPPAISLVALRNGVASGRVVVSSIEAIKGLTASIGPLTGGAGKDAIPAAGVKVLYELRGDPAGNKWFERLTETAPAETPVFTGSLRGDSAGDSKAAIQPVWVQVAVPAEATPGDYTGVLQIVPGAGAAPVSVPVKLHVEGWRIPDPRDWRTCIGLYESPRTLSLYYKVPEWSEAHWKLMDRSYQLLAQVGQKLVSIDVVDCTVFGNDDGAITWIKKPDGSFDYDLAVLDRYLKLVKKHLGVPRYVAFQVWHAGGWKPRTVDQENTVTVLDPATGKREHLQVPVFATEESKKFWTPVMLAIRDRLAKEGMEKSMCLGIGSDGGVPKEVCKMFNEILGGEARWMFSTHNPCRADLPADLPGGGKLVYNEGVYGMEPGDLDAALPLSKVLLRPGILLHPRIDIASPGCLTPLVCRTQPEFALFCRQGGFGRVGFDYWYLPGVKKTGGEMNPFHGAGKDSPPNERITPGRELFETWLRSISHPGSVNPAWLALPGPDGAETSACFEALREGLQETEAVLLLSDALEKSADRLGPELVAKCQQVLAARYEFTTRGPRWAYGKMLFHMDHYGWQELSRRTFATAAEVAAKLGGK